MSDTDDQIAKLEALLRRVRSRSLVVHPVPERSDSARLVERERALPNAVEAEAEAASPVPTAAPSPPPFPSPPPVAPSPPSPAPPPSSSTPPRKRHTSRPEVPVGLFAMQPNERYTTTTIEPPPRAPASTPRESEPPLDGGWFLEPPPMEVVELEVDPDPAISSPRPPVSDTTLEDASLGHTPAIPEPLESRSRLVIAPSSFPDGVEFPDVADDGAQPLVSSRESEEPFPLATSDPTIKAAAEVPRAESEAGSAIEDEESAPSSSRRPISLEEKMSEPDDAPTHTPPPASGRIPAASPLDLALLADSGEVDLVVVEAKTEVSVVRPEPRDADVAVFVKPGPEATERRAKTFGELLDEALSL